MKKYIFFLVLTLIGCNSDNESLNNQSLNNEPLNSESLNSESLNNEIELYSLEIKAGLDPFYSRHFFKDIDVTINEVKPHKMNKYNNSGEIFASKISKDLINVTSERFDIKSWDYEVVSNTILMNVDISEKEWFSGYPYVESIKCAKDSLYLHHGGYILNLHSDPAVLFYCGHAMIEEIDFQVESLSPTDVSEFNWKSEKLPTNIMHTWKINQQIFSESYWDYFYNKVPLDVTFDIDMDYKITISRVKFKYFDMETEELFLNKELYFSKSKSFLSFEDKGIYFMIASDYSIYYPTPTLYPRIDILIDFELKSTVIKENDTFEICSHDECSSSIADADGVVKFHIGDYVYVNINTVPYRITKNGEPISKEDKYTLTVINFGERVD